MCRARKITTCRMLRRAAEAHQGEAIAEARLVAAEASVGSPPGIWSRPTII